MTNKIRILSDVDQKIIALISEAQSLDKGFDLLVETYGQSLYNLTYQIVKQTMAAEDVLQNVFIKVFKKIHMFRGQSSLFSWLYRIAQNESYNYLRKEKKYREPIRGNVIESSNDLNSDKILDILNSAIELLPKRQKQVFEMRYFQSLSYREISSVLNLAEGSLKASFHHAVKKVENYIYTHASI